MQDLTLKPLTETTVLQKLFDQSPGYFQVILGQPPSPVAAEEAMTVLPPGCGPGQKYNLGIFARGELLAYADIIRAYPDSRYAYLGLLLIHESRQRAGMGRAVFSLLEEFVRTWPEVQLWRLGVAETNDVGGFWRKMGFSSTGRILACHQPEIQTRIIEMEKRTRPYTFHSLNELTGPNLSLKRLKREDLAALSRALVSTETWFSKMRGLDTEAKFSSYFAPMLERQERGECLLLGARKRDDGEYVAMSVFQYPGPQFRRVEIGFSWVAEAWQRTFVNREMKFLMLDHAFAEMKVNRVEFSVHPTNEKSNTAMRRLGAQFEGTLRKWRILPGAIPDDGHRNIYSILDEEWPLLRERLIYR